MGAHECGMKTDVEICVAAVCSATTSTGSICGPLHTSTLPHTFSSPPPLVQGGNVGLAGGGHLLTPSHTLPPRLPTHLSTPLIRAGWQHGSGWRWCAGLRRGHPKHTRDADSAELQSGAGRGGRGAGERGGCISSSYLSPPLPSSISPHLHTPFPYPCCPPPSRC